MARPAAKAPGAEASINVTLKGEVARYVREYQAEHGHASPAGALREILEVYFASTPMDGAVRSARDNALNSTKHWLLTRLNITLQELEGEIRAETRALERSGYGG